MLCTAMAPSRMLTNPMNQACFHTGATTVKNEQGAWLRSMKILREKNGRAFLRRLKTRGIDLVVLNKTIAVEITRPNDFSVIWQPFARVAGLLMPPRQTGEFVFRPAGEQRVRSPLREALGDPVYEDELIVVFEAP